MYGSFTCVILLHCTLVIFKIATHCIWKSSNVNVHYTKLMTFVNNTKESLLSIETLSTLWWQIHISFFNFKSSNFVLGNKYCQLFFLKWQLILSIFMKMSAKYAHLNSHSFHLLVILSDSIPWKKWLVELATQVIAQVLFLKTTIIVQHTAAVLYGYFPSHNTEY